MVEPAETEAWMAALAKTTGQQVARYRNKRELTAKQLSEELRDRLGFEMKRTVIGNLESGYRRTVSLAEILALAYVLEVPPLLLMVPVGKDEFQPLPGVRPGYEAWWSAIWITGEGPPPWVDDTTAEMVDRHMNHVNFLELYRQHHALLGRWFRTMKLPDPASAREQLDEIESSLALTRWTIKDRAGAPPRLPAELEGIDQRGRGQAGASDA